MCGNATLAIEVSSTSINVPIVTTSAMIHGLNTRGSTTVSSGEPGSNSVALGSSDSSALSRTDSAVTKMTPQSLEQATPSRDSP